MDAPELVGARGGARGGVARSSTVAGLAGGAAAGAAGWRAPASILEALSRALGDSRWMGDARLCVKCVVLGLVGRVLRCCASRGGALGCPGGRRRCRRRTRLAAKRRFGGSRGGRPCCRARPLGGVHEGAVDSRGAARAHCHRVRVLPVPKIALVLRAPSEGARGMPRGRFICKQEGARLKASNLRRRAIAK